MVAAERLESKLDFKVATDTLNQFMTASNEHDRHSEMLTTVGVQSAKFPRGSEDRQTHWIFGGNPIVTSDSRLAMGGNRFLDRITIPMANLGKAQVGHVSKQLEIREWKYTKKLPQYGYQINGLTLNKSNARAIVPSTGFLYKSDSDVSADLPSNDRLQQAPTSRHPAIIQSTISTISSDNISQIPFLRESSNWRYERRDQKSSTSTRNSNIRWKSNMPLSEDDALKGLRGNETCKTTACDPGTIKQPTVEFLNKWASFLNLTEIQSPGSHYFLSESRPVPPDAQEVRGIRQSSRRSHLSNRRPDSQRISRLRGNWTEDIVPIGRDQQRQFNTVKYAITHDKSSKAFGKSTLAHRGSNFTQKNASPRVSDNNVVPFSNGVNSGDFTRSISNWTKTKSPRKSYQNLSTTIHGSKNLSSPLCSATWMSNETVHFSEEEEDDDEYVASQFGQTTVTATSAIKGDLQGKDTRYRYFQRLPWLKGTATGHEKKLLERKYKMEFASKYKSTIPVTVINSLKEIKGDKDRHSDGSIQWASVTRRTKGADVIKGTRRRPSSILQEDDRKNEETERLKGRKTRKNEANKTTKKFIDEYQATNTVDRAQIPLISNSEGVNNTSLKYRFILGNKSFPRDKKVAAAKLNLVIMNRNQNNSRELSSDELTHRVKSNALMDEGGDGPHQALPQRHQDFQNDQVPSSLDVHLDEAKPSRSNSSERRRFKRQPQEKFVFEPPKYPSREERLERKGLMEIIRKAILFPPLPRPLFHPGIVPIAFYQPYANEYSRWQGSRFLKPRSELTFRETGPVFHWSDQSFENTSELIGEPLKGSVMTTSWTTTASGTRGTPIQTNNATSGNQTITLTTETSRPWIIPPQFNISCLSGTAWIGKAFDIKID